jgi:hypothetical protein
MRDPNHENDLLWFTWCRGELTIQVAFDHRAFDAVIIHRCLNELEKVLNNEMVAEVTKSESKLAN